MGFSHVKIFRLILLFFLMGSSVMHAASDSGVAATLTDFVMPHYRNNKLQFVLYGEKGENLGAEITLTNPLIDIVIRDLPDVELVTLMKGVKGPDPAVKRISKADPKRLYPLYSDWDIISRFWVILPHSQALIAAEKAKYDKNTRLLSGDGKLFFRSREIDIDGEGFDADQKKKFIHVRKNVQVVFRPYASELTRKSARLMKRSWAEKGVKSAGDVRDEVIGELKKFIETANQIDQKKKQDKK